MTTLRIASTNYPLQKLNDFSAWKKKQTQWLSKAAKAKAEIIIFPEYASLEICSFLKARGLRQQLSAFQEVIPEMCAFYKEASKSLQLTIVAPSYPLIRAEGVFNRVDIFTPETQYQQEKKKITRFEKAAWKIKPSPLPFCVFEIKSFRCAVLICYDCEFPTHALSLLNEKIDLLIIPSCTEAQSGVERVHIGARARALELQCYSAVSQIIGKASWCQAIDQNSGYSAIYTPPDAQIQMNGIVSRSPLNRAALSFALLDKKKLEKQRANPEVTILSDLQL